MGDSHQKLLDDYTVHPNFLNSSLYLHALIVRARFATLAALAINITMNMGDKKLPGKLKNELIFSALILICSFIST